MQPTADVESRPDVAARIAAACDRHAPSRLWHLDALLSVMLAAGPGASGARPAVASTAAWLLAAADSDVHAAVTHKLFALLAAAVAGGGGGSGSGGGAGAEVAASLLQTACWAVGAYGEMLTAPPQRPAGADDMTGPFGES